MSTRTRSAAIVAAAALALTLAGCATPVTTGPTDPAGLEPSPSVTATASAPSPSASAESAGPEGIDGVRVGEPFASETDGIAGFMLVEGCEGVGTATREGYTLTVQRDGAGGEDSDVVLVSASVTADEAGMSGPVTAEGVGIGSTVAEALAAYPDADEVASEGDRRHLRVAEADGSALFLSYTEGDEVIWALTATSLESPPYEPCA